MHVLVEPYNRILKYGHVICDVPENKDPKKSRVAGLVFSRATDPIFIIPRSLFEVSEEEKRTITNSQYMKRTRTFGFGQPVHFSATDDGMILKCYKGNVDDHEKVIFLDNKNPAILSEAVFTPEKDLYVITFQKTFKVDPFLHEIILPNVLYEVWIELQMDYGWYNNQPCEEWPFDRTIFQPEYTTKFYGLKSVKYQKGLVEAQAWNLVNIPTRSSLLLLDKFEDISTFGNIDYRDKNYFNIRVVALSNQIAFSPRFPNDLIVNGLPKECNGNIEEGLLFQVNLYYCKYNNVLVPFSINIPYERAKVKCNKELKLFFVDVCNHEQGGFYFNIHFGVLYDSKRLLEGYTPKQIRDIKFRAWIREIKNFSKNFAKFEIVELEEPTNKRIEEFSNLFFPIEQSCGILITKERIYCKEYSNFLIGIPKELQDIGNIGDTVAFNAHWTGGATYMVSEYRVITKNTYNFCFNEGANSNSFYIRLQQCPSHFHHRFIAYHCYFGFVRDPTGKVFDILSLETYFLDHPHLQTKFKFPEGFWVNFEENHALPFRVLDENEVVILLGEESIIEELSGSNNPIKLEGKLIIEDSSVESIQYSPPPSNNTIEANNDFQGDEFITTAIENFEFCTKIQKASFSELLPLLNSYLKCEGPLCDLRNRILIDLYQKGNCQKTLGSAINEELEQLVKAIMQV